MVITKTATVVGSPSRMTSAWPKSAWAWPGGWESGTKTSAARRLQARTASLTVVSPPWYPCSARSRSKIRLAECRCFFGAFLPSSRIWWTTGRRGSRIDGRRGLGGGDPGGSGLSRIFLRVFQWIVYSRQAARPLRPSARTRRRISAPLSMLVYTPLPHCWCPRWSANRPPSWAGSGESDQGCRPILPPVGRGPALHYPTDVLRCAERFIRTLKEDLLWIRAFATVAGLVEALREFKRTYDEK